MSEQENPTNALFRESVPALAAAGVQVEPGLPGRHGPTWRAIWTADHDVEIHFLVSNKTGKLLCYVAQKSGNTDVPFANPFVFRGGAWVGPDQDRGPALARAVVAALDAAKALPRRRPEPSNGLLPE